MIRRLLSVIAFVGASFFLLTGVASAKDYVPVPVTTSVNAVSPAADTSSGAIGSALSYTGSGINVGGAVLIGALVLALGIALCVVGAKLSRRRSA